VSLFLGASGPGNGDQERALLQRFDIVVYPVVQRHQFSGGKINFLIRQMDAEACLQRMDRDPGIGMMLLHLCVRLHEDQDDPEVRVLREGLRTAPRLALPRVFLPKAPKFVREIELQEWAGQVRQPV
jgi:hypothetical protein